MFEHFLAKRQRAIEHGCVTRSSGSRTWIVNAGDSHDKPDSTTPEVKLMAYLHCRTRIQILTRIQIPNLTATLYYVQHIHIEQTWIHPNSFWGWISVPRLGYESVSSNVNKNNSGGSNGARVTCASSPWSKFFQFHSWRVGAPT